MRTRRLSNGGIGALVEDLERMLSSNSQVDGSPEVAFDWPIGRPMPLPELLLDPGAEEIPAAQEEKRKKKFPRRSPSTHEIPCNTKGDGDAGNVPPSMPIPDLESSNEEAEEGRRKRRRATTATPTATASQPQEEDPYGLNELVEAIVRCNANPVPTTRDLEELAEEVGILVYRRSTGSNKYVGVSPVDVTIVFKATITLPGYTLPFYPQGQVSEVIQLDGGRYLELDGGRYLDPKVAARRRDMLIVKTLLCGVRWYHRSCMPELNFPIIKYLAEMRKPRVVAMTDPFQYSQYLREEMSDYAYRFHMAGLNGVFWNNRRHCYQAFVWNVEERDYSQGKLIKDPQGKLMKGPQDKLMKEVMKGASRGRCSEDRLTAQWKFTTREEAALAHDKEAIRIGAWRHQKLNYPFTRYVEDILFSPFMRDYIRTMPAT